MLEVTLARLRGVSGGSDGRSGRGTVVGWCEWHQSRASPGKIKVGPDLPVLEHGTVLGHSFLACQYWERALTDCRNAKFLVSQ